MESESEPISAGRGRGRGRGGGVPLLPTGLWDELGKADAPTSEDPKLELKSSDELNSMDSMQFMSFGGGGRGTGRGRGRGRGRGQERSGPGFEKDAKGPDWECPSCSNVNWSWRSTCNRCSTVKPGGAVNDIEKDTSAQERVSTSTLEIAEDGFDDFGRRAKGGRKDKSAKELAALARLQSNYGFLVNPTANALGLSEPPLNQQSDSRGREKEGQFADANESGRGSKGSRGNDRSVGNVSSSRMADSGGRPRDRDKEEDPRSRRRSLSREKERLGARYNDGSRRGDGISGSSRRDEDANRDRSKRRSRSRSRDRDRGDRGEHRARDRTERDRSRDGGRRRDGDRRY